MHDDCGEIGFIRRQVKRIREERREGSGLGQGFFLPQRIEGVVGFLYRWEGFCVTFSKAERERECAREREGLAGF